MARNVKKRDNFYAGWKIKEDKLFDADPKLTNEKNKSSTVFQSWRWQWKNKTWCKFKSQKWRKFDKHQNAANVKNTYHAGQKIEGYNK